MGFVDKAKLLGVYPVCLGYLASVQSTGPGKIFFEAWPFEIHAE